MLEIINIHKTFNAGTINEKRALQGVNLHLKPGDFCTVIGGNAVFYSSNGGASEDSENVWSSTIPYLRGKFRSRQMDDILYEARLLADSGVKELIVVAQDTSRYGIDLPGHKRLLPELLTELCKIEEFFLESKVSVDMRFTHFIEN